jgi:hypothetical protein
MGRLASEPERAAPPRQLQLAPPSAAEFVICDHTIEGGFKDMKRGGWQWQQTKMTDPARAERLWLALAVATLWVISVGSDLEVEPPATVVEVPDLQALLGRRAPIQPRQTRLFRLGWLWLLVRALKGTALPLPSRLVPEPWPDVPQQLILGRPLHKRLSYAYM